MNAASAQLRNPAITDTVNNGINEFIFVSSRGNYLVPSRAQRSFPGSPDDGSVQAEHAAWAPSVRRRRVRRDRRATHTQRTLRSSGPGSGAWWTTPTPGWALRVRAQRRLQAGRIDPHADRSGSTPAIPAPPCEQ